MAGTDAAARQARAIVDDGSGIVGFADWAEQLIAESHRQARHRHPARRRRRRRRPRGAPARRRRAPSSARRRLRRRRPSRRPPTASRRAPRSTSAAPLGAQLLLWEAATAVAGRLLGINPFDQPDVESAKKAARGLLDARPARPTTPAFTDGAIEVRALGGDWLGDGQPPSPTALDALLDQLDPHHGYVAVMAYLDRLADAELADGPRGAGAAHRAARRPSAGARASCTPPASSTRAARRPASTCRSPTAPARGPRRPGPRRSPSATSSPPRPAATRRCSPTTAGRCCGCT